MESASASDASSVKDQKKEMEKLRDALKENTEQMKALLSAHSKTTTVVQELSLEVKEAKWQLQEMQEDNDRGRASIQDKLKEFRSTVEDLQEQFKEAMEDFLDHGSEEGEKATEEEEEQEDTRARKEGAELRREGHFRGTTSRTTPPTSSRKRTGRRTTEEQEEYSDKGMFEKLMEAEEDYEAYLENENEYYTQSYTGSTNGDYPWEEEEGEEGEGKKESKGSGEEGPGLTEEEQEEERKRKIKEINQRTKEKEKETEGFQYLHDYTKEWKEYSEDGQIYRQHYVTKEKIWIDRDYTHKHEKGGKGKKGKGKSSFVRICSP